MNTFSMMRFARTTKFHTHTHTRSTQGNNEFPSLHVTKLIRINKFNKVT